MSLNERQVIAKKIVQYFEKFGLKDTIRHFIAQGEKKSTIYGTVSRYQRTGTSVFGEKCGRNRSVSTEQVSKTVKRKLLNTNKSIRQVAKEVGISYTTAHNIKRRAKIMTAKCTQTPKYTQRQIKLSKTNARKVYRMASRKRFIIDDETYVTCDPRDTGLPKSYHYKDKTKVPDEVRFKTKTKFPKRFLVWQAIDECGNVSKPYVKQGTLKGEEYREECLRKILLPFIGKYHSNSKHLFWPDLATIHYEKTVLQFMKQNGITFVPKASNAPNVPQARPIERFWYLCKLEYSKRSGVYNDIKSFRKVWSEVSKKVAEMYAQNLMSSTRKNLKLIADHGVFEPFKH